MRFDYCMRALWMRFWKIEFGFVWLLCLKKSQLCLVSGFGQIGGQMIDGRSQPDQCNRTILGSKLYHTLLGRLNPTNATYHSSQVKTLPYLGQTTTIHDHIRPRRLNPTNASLPYSGQKCTKPHFTLTRPVQPAGCPRSNHFKLHRFRY